MDRKTGNIWSSGNCESQANTGHFVLPLLVHFLDAIQGAKAAATVAVTSYRTFHAID